MKRVRPILLLIAFAAVFAACKTEKDFITEPVKDLSGTWGIYSVVKNASDITPYVDTAGFRLVMQQDGSYSFTSTNIPFLIAEGSAGTWSTDDPLYPYTITFKDADSSNAIVASVTTPVKNANRAISITFSPGCKANIYNYTLLKISQ